MGADSTDKGTHSDRLGELRLALAQLGYSGAEVDDEPAISALAYALSEIAESCKKVQALVGELVEASSHPSGSICTLHEVREELAHIVYHIKDSPFLGAVMDR